MGEHQQALQRSLERLSRDLSGQPEASVLAELRGDDELSHWGWTDNKLADWAHQIAANEQAVYRPNDDD